MIGRRCNSGNAGSRAILIAQTLSGNGSSRAQRNESSLEERRTDKCEANRVRVLQRRALSFESEFCFPSILFTFYGHRRIAGRLKETKAAIARGFHLFPFRTEKLNPAAPMVLRKWESR